MPNKDDDLIRERIISREAKIATWESEKAQLQSRIDQYRRMIQRDKDYLNGSTDETI